MSNSTARPGRPSDGAWRREPDHQLTFAGRPASVGAMRDWLGHHLRLSRHRYPATLQGDLLLCASEIATNTLHHTRSGLPGGFFTVSLWTGYRRAFLAVRDMGPLPAAPTVPHIRTGILDDLGTESGRGLPMVAMLTGDRCGATAPPDPRGHTVWCELRADSTP
ncbi:MAG: ATP-binding protein [Nocardiopsaceae bacterium]|nr:ATP-binding protein [Nocardiopsaceae bacterium]